MELKEFVKKVIMDLDEAVSEANDETKREIRFKGVKEHRTALEFDVAVTVETSNSGKGGGEIKVWGIGEVGATTATEFKNSTISRVSFGVDISEKTKNEIKLEGDEMAKRVLETRERNSLNSAR